MKCPKCKKGLEQGMKFCPFCGTKAEKQDGSIIFKLLLPLSVAVVGCVIGIFIAAHLGKEELPSEILETTLTNTETSATVSRNSYEETDTASDPDFQSIVSSTYAGRDSMSDTLTIHEVNGNQVVFSACWPAIWCLDEAIAILNGNDAAFDYDYPMPHTENIRIKGTIVFEDNAAVLKITESNAYIETGEYDYGLVGRELSDEQLSEISRILDVPEDLEVQITQGEPVYWEDGGFYRTPVEIYHNGELIAGASVDSLSGGLAGNIYMYSSSRKTLTADDGPEDASSVRTKDVLRFGHYEQDGLRSNGAEPIAWRVLDVQDGKALLISLYALDSQPYNRTYGSITWEECTLRNWLNSTFIETAFTEKEKAAILMTEVDNSTYQNNPEWHAKVGNNTEDKIFLLSYADVDRYFDNYEDRICTPTDYAVSQGADVRTLDDGKTDAGWWWLRSPGETSSQASFVNVDGTRYTNRVGNGYLAVRPALWIDLGEWSFYGTK